MEERAKARSALKAIALGLTIVTLSIVLNPIVWRVCCYKPYSTPSRSMEPALLVGDHWMASTWAYWGTEPKRGDVVVFRHPTQADSDFVKRIIGLPGDTIEMRAGQVILNGQPIGYVRTSDYVVIDDFGNRLPTRQFMETLPEGRSYPVLDFDSDSSGDTMRAVTVPAGHYFMLGDNRDNSNDSRFDGSGSMGMVPAKNIIGRATIIHVSFANGVVELSPDSIRWSRLLKHIE